MIYNPMKYLGTLALLLLLAPIVACTQQTTTPLAMRSSYDEQALKLKIKGQDATDALDSSTKIVDLLDELDAPPAANIKARIKMLLNTPGAKIAGLGGIQSRAALKTAEVTTNPSGNFAGPLTTFAVKGQIQESVDIGLGLDESGFYYKLGDPMHMWVQMITTATRITGGPTKVTRWAEMFRIEVPANAVIVEPKSSDTGLGVFPGFGSVAFPISSTMANDHQFKLWAVGEDVKVTDYWIDDNYNSGTGPVYMASKKYTMGEHPAKFASIFAQDLKACIDMMFKKDPRVDVADGGALANGELPSDAEPPYYCLGRCQNPPIVNTK